MQPGDAVVALDLLLALGAFALREGRLDSFLYKNQKWMRRSSPCLRVSLDPVVQHLLRGPRRLDVRRDARRRRPLHTPLVHRVLAY